jgi:hypothetical protein
MLQLWKRISPVVPKVNIGDLLAGLRKKLVGQTGRHVDDSPTCGQETISSRLFSAWIFREKSHNLTNICFQQKGRIGM